MSRAVPMQASFNAGEISPLMMGRLDQNVYSIAGEKMENFVPLIQGPMLKRSGIRHVAAAKGPCRLIDFEYNTTQAYIIEAGEEYARFYTNNAQIMDGEDPYEIETPYSHAEVLELDMVASADVLYLVHGLHAPRTLSRLTAETFALAELSLTGGPFDDDNINEALTVTASASTGAVTLTASAGIFSAGHVGGLFKMEARDFAEIPAWEPYYTMAAGALRTWEGKVYQNVGGTGRTGNVPPIHSDGVEWDGTGQGTDLNDKNAGGVQWQYVHDRVGILRITGYTSPTEVSATVLRRLPFNAATVNSYSYSHNYVNPWEPEEDFEPPSGAVTYDGKSTWRWAFGAFSEARGWPSRIYIWNERLVLTKGATLYASVVGAYTDFRERNDAGELTADMAFRATLNSPNAIRWIAGDVDLLIGTAKQEHVGSAMGGTGVPGPGNFKAPAQTDFGSAEVKPVSVGGRVLFAEKSGRRIHQLDFELTRERFDSDDLTVMADHVTRGGVKWLARQAAPHSIVWAGMGNGMLAALSFSPRQEVKSWCRCPLAEGSLARWGACIPDPLGERDQLWLYIERGEQHLIGYLEVFWDAGDDRANAFFLDHGLSYDDDPADEFSGLDHLEGETVQILADGKPHPDRVVTDGAVALEYEASKVHVGLFYRAYFKSLRIEAGSDDGTAQGKIKRISRLTARLLDTAGVRFRVQGGAWEDLDLLRFGDTLDEARPLVTGDYPMETIGDYDREGQIEIESFQPLPACILALTPTIKTGAA